MSGDRRTNADPHSTRNTHTHAATNGGTRATYIESEQRLGCKCPLGKLTRRGGFLMARLTLVGQTPKNGANLAHRASSSEGEAARKLLEQQGFDLRGPKNKQYETSCPFHEGPGGGKVTSPKFYMNVETSKYFCFAGETRVITREGVRPIVDLVGKVELLTANPDGQSKSKSQKRRGRWVEAEVKSFGLQPLMKVTLSRNGVQKEIFATPEHRWFLWSQGKSGSVTKTTEELAPGRRLLASFPYEVRRDTIVSSIGVAHGITYGDGTRRQGGSSVDLWDDKNAKLLPFFPEPHTRAIVQNGVHGLTVFGLPAYFKERPPITEASNYLLGWLAGFFAADGTVSKSGTVSLQLADREDLEFVRDVCTRLGIGTYGINAYERIGIDGKPGMMYHLTFMGSTIPDNFFKIPEHQARFDFARDRGRLEHYGWTVVSVEETDRVEEVFCAVVPETHAFVLEDNILTGNCQSASCGEKGNLRTLEKYFGIEEDDAYISAFRTREQELREFELNLTPVLRDPFYDHGLTDVTIERFRLGYQPEHTTASGQQIPGRYVIPYLENRRPKFFRFYSPYGEKKFKYTWESNAESTLFNPGDAMGDPKDGIAYLCEGELKAMLLCQMGYAAVAVPGASNWKDEYQALFTHARRVFVCYDNDNPEHPENQRDKPDAPCLKCSKTGLTQCVGHNPGQDAAVQRVEQLGWRAKNVLLPWPDTDEPVKKTDINDFFMRDGRTNGDFAELATGKRATPYKVSTLGEIMLSPPEEAEFLIEQGILSKGGRLLVAGKPKVGKGTGLTHNLLTPHGWKQMGSIQVGDEVIGVDGMPTQVLQIHPLGVRKLYKVSMSDGSSTLCTDEHLWTYQTHNDREYAKKDGRPRWRTDNIMVIKDLLDQGKSRDTHIPMVEPVEFDQQAGPKRIAAWAHEVGGGRIDPYGLGLLLGDAHLGRTPTFSKPDMELHEALAKLLPAELHLLKSSRCPVSSVTKGDREVNVVTAMLDALSLTGCRSWEKFIPEEFLRASVQDRLSLLQGLCDTDGWVQWNASKKNSSAYFGTSSERLKDGFVELVESLGGTTRVLHKPAPKFQDGGIGRPAWTVRVRLPKQFEPFRLTRKLDEWRSGRTSKETEPVRKIVSVEYSHDEEAQCITVDREDGLYVTERFIVTHNSLFINNLALSLASGLPFLRSGGNKGYKVDHPTRTLLLDRELSKRSLFDRLTTFTSSVPAFQAAHENLLIDHDHMIRLDQLNAYETLVGLIEENGAEVCILDTAYKFFGGDVESSASLMKGFGVLDKVIHETGCSFVLTHHLKKSAQSSNGKQAIDFADPDGVAGSFLWTGWPNGTILLNFLNRSVENPFNSVATFTAFRDAAPPDPVVLYRDRTSITYTAVEQWTPPDDITPGHTNVRPQVIKPTTEAVANLLLEVCPCTEEDFLHMASGHFGVSVPTVKPYFIDVMSGDDFERTKSSGKHSPAIIKFKHEVVPEQSWEEEHNLPERKLPDNAGIGIDVGMFDAAGVITDV